MDNKEAEEIRHCSSEQKHLHVVEAEGTLADNKEAEAEETRVDNREAEEQRRKKRIRQ